ncbi:hypothetical protein [Sphingomonas sp. KC8]|uniref:hypothetical protein n=1 Tax=Sphingomonas sp. KC8 TaxID=1030157 RepID=UPI0002489312|nr:hypothetical protein [Sphingomonas sp. KC8]ARS26639.1 hypothetical protein KC8_04965 [Sphingomonas sp. KC8]
MTHSGPCLFADAAAVRRIGEGLIARTLPREDWTHEAHIAACVWLLRERPDILPERDLPAIIAAYNEAVGGVNDDNQGYHETITQCFVRATRIYLAREGDCDLLGAVNGQLGAAEGRREWPLHFYSRERLFTVDARRGYVEPDLAQLPTVMEPC